MARVTEYEYNKAIQIFGLPAETPFDRFNKTYRNLVKDCHPDKNPGNKAAEEKFKALGNSLETIKNYQKQKINGQPDTTAIPKDRDLASRVSARVSILKKKQAQNDTASNDAPPYYRQNSSNRPNVRPNNTEPDQNKPNFNPKQEIPEVESPLEKIINTSQAHFDIDFKEVQKVLNIHIEKHPKDILKSILAIPELEFIPENHINLLEIGRDTIRSKHALVYAWLVLGKTDHQGLIVNIARNCIAGHNTIEKFIKTGSLAKTLLTRGLLMSPVQNPNLYSKAFNKTFDICLGENNISALCNTIERTKKIAEIYCQEEDPLDRFHEKQKIMGMMFDTEFTLTNTVKIFEIAHEATRSLGIVAKLKQQIPGFMRKITYLKRTNHGSTIINLLQGIQFIQSKPYRTKLNTISNLNKLGDFLGSFCSNVDPRHTGYFTQFIGMLSGVSTGYIDSNFDQGVEEWVYAYKKSFHSFLNNYEVWASALDVWGELRLVLDHEGNEVQEYNHLGIQLPIETMAYAANKVVEESYSKQQGFDKSKKLKDLLAGYRYTKHHPKFRSHHREMYNHPLSTNQEDAYNYLASLRNAKQRRSVGLTRNKLLIQDVNYLFSLVD